MYIVRIVRERKRKSIPVRVWMERNSMVGFKWIPVTLTLNPQYLVVVY